MKKQENPYQEKVNDFNNRFEKKQKKEQKQKKQQKKEQKKLNPSKIIINVAQTQYPVVRLVSKRLKWSLTTEPISSLNFDICWIDGHCRQQIFARMQPFQKINHFPGMQILSRKNFLGKSLMEFKKKFPQEYDFFPLTWNLPTDFAALKDYHDNRKEGKAQTFIVKPEASCQGRGISLTRNIDKLKYQKCVVQRYMAKPLLIDGLKFDLRIYVLIAGIDPLRIFVFNEGLARFCTAPYQAPKSDNLTNMFMHLTNYAINKLSPEFIFNENAKQCDKGHKRSLSSIYKTLQQMGHNSRQIKQRINDMLIKTIITGYPTLSRMQQSSHPQNFSNDMCFQILGFDVILNHQLNPFILEVNYTPSFTTDSPFDKLVKKNLIHDTFKILNINQKWKKEVRKKRQGEVKDRMLSGKRTKYTIQERNQLTQKYAKIRDQYEADNLGGFQKIFCLSQEQMLKYAHFYEFAEFLYQKDNKLTGVSTSKSFIPFYMPFAKSPKNTTMKQFSRTGAFSSAKYISRPTLTREQGRGPKSIQNRKMINSKAGKSPSIKQQTTLLVQQEQSISAKNFLKQISRNPKLSSQPNIEQTRMNKISNGINSEMFRRKPFQDQYKINQQINKLEDQDNINHYQDQGEQNNQSSQSNSSQNEIFDDHKIQT